MATTKTDKQHVLSHSDAAALKEFVALARKVKFPGGKDARDYTKGTDYSPPECSFSWSKRGGHAGSKTVSSVARAAVDAGFEPFDSKRHDVPDGSRIGSTGTYVLLDEEKKVFATLQCSTSYGAVASENYYSLTLKGPKLGKDD